LVRLGTPLLTCAHVGLEPISSQAQLVSIFINLKGVLMVELGSIEAELTPFYKK
jgi:hypothetical protein